MPSALTEQRLDLLLAEASEAAAYPTTPDLSAAVLAAVVHEPAPEVTRPLRQLAMVAAALLVLVILGSLALTPSRTAIAEFFGLVEGERIEVLPAPAATAKPTPASTATATAPAAAISPNTSATPTPTATPRPTPTPRPPASLEEIGEPTTLAAAEAAAGFAARLPGTAGEPVAVYLVRYGEFPVIVLQYEDFDLWQARGTGFGYFEKRVPPETVIETPEVSGEFGYWVESGGHIVSFFDAEGDAVAGSERTVERNALIWRAEERFFRLETDLSFEAALAIAESLR